MAFGSHAVQDNYTVHVGTGIEVLGMEAEVLVHCGTNGATGTVDTKIQESDDNITFIDWTGGAFTQVTTANDNADYKKPYTGTKRYIRTVSKVLLAACEFGTSILVNTSVTGQDTALARTAKSARREVEDLTSRKLLTQTWYYYLDRFPDKDFIVIPFGNLQSVTSVKYKDSDGTETTLTVTTEYLVETNGEGCGRIVLPYGCSWPSATLYPSNPITIEFVCGWTAAANIPENLIAAILLQAEREYFHGDRDAILDRAITNLVRNYRLREEF